MRSSTKWLCHAISLTKTSGAVAAGLPGAAVVLQMTVLSAVAGVLALTDVPVAGVRAVSAVEAGGVLAGGGQVGAGVSCVARGTDTGRGEQAGLGETDPAVLTPGLTSTGGGGGADGAGSFPVVT